MIEVNTTLVTINEELVIYTEEVIKTRRTAIQPFKECPGTERNLSSCSDKNSRNATELFSIFTADIIKEKVIFTR